jgi:hypothetical protein
VLGDVVPAFERLRQQGKTRFLGLTAIGETAALHQVIDTRAFDSAQVVYNMLNPSAAAGLPTNYPAQDYGPANHGDRSDCRGTMLTLRFAVPACRALARSSMTRLSR